MAPKKAKKRQDRFRCDEIHGEEFHAQIEEVFGYNWWDVFCFPYILGARIWDCCVSLCAGTNQCLVYWMMIQWLVCKITKLTTPDPIIFPYYFYMFCQVILLTLFFVMVWRYIGTSVVIPYFMAYYEAWMEVEETQKPKNATRLSFRKYCFRKGEIFDTPYENSSLLLKNGPITIVSLLIEVFIYDVLR